MDDVTRKPYRTAFDGVWWHGVIYRPGQWPMLLMACGREMGLPEALGEGYANCPKCLQAIGRSGSDG